jgi:hypothetical protein
MEPSLVEAWSNLESFDGKGYDGPEIRFFPKELVIEEQTQMSVELEMHAQKAHFIVKLRGSELARFVICVPGKYWRKEYEDFIARRLHNLAFSEDDGSSLILYWVDPEKSNNIKCNMSGDGAEMMLILPLDLLLNPLHTLSGKLI